ncbi:MAG: DUF3536 domain-containing protein [Gemmatimonadales bacterium]
MRHTVIHGHFYQPPREEPWLELIPREPTALPDHDWNERITRECYAPLAHARVLDDAGRLRRVLNAYAWCSFNVGATLYRWFDEHAPEVGAAFQAGDAASRARLGFGNAIAMPYHHIIMPLASRRDKLTEVRWGIRDFRARFGRDPEGMWLPETAVDSETLEILAAEGIQFTILAPHQLESPPLNGRAGRWRSNTGSELAIFSYNGVLAHEVAFGDMLSDAGRWAEALHQLPLADDGGPTINAIATDGETFGHHRRFGDLALASLIDRLECDAPGEMTNYSALLAAHPPQTDVTLVEKSSWSCIHGIERWRIDCGCRMDPTTNQAWRAPLRAALEVLAQGVHAVAESAWPAEAGNLWEARDAAGPDLAGVAHLPVLARRLLEAERHALAMFTSCGWFFDDIARIEPRIDLRHAARAIEFLPHSLHRPLETALLSALGRAVSNDPTKGDGVAIWYRDVLAESDGPARLAAGLAALRDVRPDALDDLDLPSHTWRLEGDDIVTHHRTTGREYRWQAETETLGVVPILAWVHPLDEPQRDDRVIPISAFPGPVRTLLLQVARPMVFEATLTPHQRDQLRDGIFDHDSARLLALAGAWALIERDGAEDAGIVLHAVLDLYDLDEIPIPDEIRVEAFERLSRHPASDARTSLANRLLLALPRVP